MKKIKTLIIVIALILSITSNIYACNQNNNGDLLSVEKENLEDKEDIMLKLTIDGNDVKVLWEDNASVNELKELVKNNSLKIETHQYGGFEQVGEIGRSIRSNNTQMTTSAGDIVLYAGSNIVIFYGSNSWSYTKLGKIIDKTDEELKTMLNKNSTILELSKGANK